MAVTDYIKYTKAFVYNLLDGGQTKLYYTGKTKSFPSTVK